MNTRRAGGGDAPAGTLPRGVAEWRTPGHWKSIDFISDLHLCPALARTTALWARYLEQTSADAVCILGDLFEVWIGDDARFQSFEQSLVSTLAAASRRRSMHFMAGNRDFLVGPALLDDCGLTALPDPVVLDAWGRRLMLTHGDALCLADHAYQDFRRLVRSAGWQHRFLARSFAERSEIASGIRHQSNLRRQFDGDAAADVDRPSCIGWLHATGSTALIHGHTHRPGDEVLAGGLTRHVLSDWDADDERRPRAEVLRLTADGLQRLPVDAALST